MERLSVREKKKPIGRVKRVKERERVHGSGRLALEKRSGSSASLFTLLRVDVVVFGRRRWSCLISLLLNCQVRRAKVFFFDKSACLEASFHRLPPSPEKKRLGRRWWHSATWRKILIAGSWVTRTARTDPPVCLGSERSLSFRSWHVAKDTSSIGQFC